MKKIRLSTLMYHDIVEKENSDSSGFKGAAAAAYKLSPKQFLDQIETINDKTKTKPVTVENMPDNQSWMLTFDDGGESAYSIVADILEERGWLGHFFISTDYIDTEGFLDKNKIKKLRKRGHVIGTHSCSHPEMNKSDYNEILYQWQHSIEVLSNILGEKITSASIPGGQYNERVIKAAQQVGINYLFTSSPVTYPKCIGDCLVIGRFGIKNTTSSSMVANLAGGLRSYWLYQKLWWDFKQVVKNILQ